MVDLSATYNAQKFSMPIAIAVELQAGSDQEFDMVLDTTDAGGAHLYYRLQLRGDGPPRASHGSDNQNFADDGKGTSTNTAWADGAKHTLMLVFNGKRLLFYIDNQPLLDTAIPQPNSTAALTLGTVNEAKVTGINIYKVP